MISIFLSTIIDQFKNKNLIKEPSYSIESEMFDDPNLFDSLFKDPQQKVSAAAPI